MPKASSERYFDVSVRSLLCGSKGALSRQAKIGNSQPRITPNDARRVRRLLGEAWTDKRNDSKNESTRVQLECAPPKPLQASLVSVDDSNRPTTEASPWPHDSPPRARSAPWRSSPRPACVLGVATRPRTIHVEPAAARATSARRRDPRRRARRGARHVGEAIRLDPARRRRGDPSRVRARRDVRAAPRGTA